MKKIIFFAIGFQWVLSAAGQKTEGSSSFYDKPVGQVHSLLVEYRREVFDRKSQAKFVSTLTEKCSTKNITVFFAEIGSAVDDSLRQAAEFVCRISNADFKVPFREDMNVPMVMGAGLRDKKYFTFLGFTNVYSGTPDWKCNCTLKSNEISQFDPAGCLFERLVADGIILH